MSDNKHEAATRLPPSLHFERRDAVGILRLFRPHKRNALDDATIQGIENFFAAIPDDIKRLVVPIFAHRVIVNTRTALSQRSSDLADRILQEILTLIDVPL